MADPAHPPRSVRVPAAALEGFARAARLAMPGEACGLVLGRVDDGRLEVDRLVTTRNVAETGAFDRFEVDPSVHLSLQRMLRGTDRAVIGCIHSHPSGPAEPSDEDSRSAVDANFLWLIFSVDQGLTAAWWHRGGGAFTPLTLDIL